MDETRAEWKVSKMAEMWAVLMVVTLVELMVVTLVELMDFRLAETKVELKDVQWYEMMALKLVGLTVG